VKDEDSYELDGVAQAERVPGHDELEHPGRSTVRSSGAGTRTCSSLSQGLEWYESSKTCERRGRRTHEKRQIAWERRERGQSGVD
jgi:hypothetical protein